MPVNPKLIAIGPIANAAYSNAITEAGATESALGPEVGGLIWTDYHSPLSLAQALDANPQLRWVQLPWAGVDAFQSIISRQLIFTCAKGAFREPVAEHALILCMALARKLPERVRAKSWGSKYADSLYDSNVVIIGGGGIALELIRLLAPFRARVSIVRREDMPLEGASQTVTFKQLEQVLPSADFVILACSLTPETKGLFDLERLKLLKPQAYLVNVARGPIVVTEHLITALKTGVLAAAALDVTDPEPLPDGHPAWDIENLLITPHTADTPKQVEFHLAKRIRENVSAYMGEGQWVGLVDPELGY